MQGGVAEPAALFWQSRPFRYVVNGLVATAVHFAVLTFNLKVLAFASAGLANLSVVVTDGPFTESVEQVVGFYLLESTDEADLHDVVRAVAAGPGLKPARIDGVIVYFALSREILLLVRGLWRREVKHGRDVQRRSF